MRPLYLCCVLMLGCAAGSLQAQVEAPTELANPPPSSSHELSPSESPSAAEDPSASLSLPPIGSRDSTDTNSWTLGLEPLGFAVSLPSIGASLGYGLNPDLILELNHARSNLGFYVMSVYARVTSLRLKKYWTRSFYTNVGLALRTVGANISVAKFGVPERFNTELEVSSLTGDLAIGNRWQIGRVAVGCDWLGWMPHLRVVESRNKLPHEQPSDEGDRDTNAFFERIAARGTPQFLRFYIGTVF